MARLIRLTALAGALVALPLVAANPVLAKHKHGHKAHGTKEKVDSSAYPKSPGGTPATSDDGKPVEPKADASSKPNAPAKASTESAPSKTGTPSTAYPGAPGGGPAAADGGKPVQPKP